MRLRLAPGWAGVGGTSGSSRTLPNGHGLMDSTAEPARGRGGRPLDHFRSSASVRVRSIDLRRNAPVSGDPNE